MLAVHVDLDEDGLVGHLLGELLVRGCDLTARTAGLLFRDFVG